MSEKKIITKYVKTDFDLLTNSDKTLVLKAKSMLKSAYAPYSGFLVGASLLLENGKIISGNNQENVAYPSGLCAERVAIYYAGAQFPNLKIKKIAISAISKKFNFTDIVSPCGSCRQAIAEYEIKQEDNIKILLHHSNDNIIIVNSVSDLLPLMFKSKDLKNF